MGKPAPPDDTITKMLETIYPVSRETIVRFAKYEAMLHQWQEKTNLVSRTTLDDFWVRHVADSLQLISLAPNARHWTDIGSGGGFPGLVIAIVMREINEVSGEHVEVNLVESIGKKCAFLRRVTTETAAAAAVHNIRIESATKLLNSAEIVTARAVTSLNNLLLLTGHVLAGDRRALFHKGRDYLAELAECDGKWKFDLVVHRSRIDADSVILDISNVEQIVDTETGKLSR